VLAQEITQRIDGILDEATTSVEEVKQTRDSVPGTDPEETFPLLAQKIVDEANAILERITPELEEVKVTEVVGRDVIHLTHSESYYPHRES